LLVFQNVFPRDIQEIQGDEEVSGGGVKENNKKWRKEDK
jgi:hypothetical protein